MAFRLNQRATPLAVAAAAFVLAMVFVGLRLAIAADGDVSRFVVAGSIWVDEATVPVDLHVFDGPGYDGQFQWRLAADPGELAVDRHLGVELDGAMRSQRIGYPLLAWLGSGGSDAAVVWSLVGVNLVALAALAGLGGVLARDGGRSGWWGLALASVPGFVFVLARDLTELTAATALVGGIVALRRERWWLAAGIWAFGVLTREQLVISIAAYGLLRLVEVFRERRLRSADLPWLVPGVVFLGWQALVGVAVGEVAGSSGVSPHIGWPFVGFLEAFSDRIDLGDASMRTRATSAAWFIEVGVLVALVVDGWRRRLSTADAWLRLAVGMLAVFVCLLTDRIWGDPADLRTMTDLFVLGWVVLLLGAGPTMPRRLVGAQLIATGLAAGVLIGSI